MRNYLLKLIALVLFVCLLFVLYSCYNDTHSHSLTHHDAKEPTCVQDGNIEYWHCADCNKYFSDEKANEEIDDIVISYGHKLVYNEATAVSCTENGALEHWLCTECHLKFSDGTAATLLYNVFLPGEHCFVNGTCENCSSEGTPELIYKLIDGQYSVVGIDNSEVIRIVIPSFYNEIPVVAICDKAFEGCSELMSVEIGENITMVGSGVFDGCDRLIEIVNNANISLPDRPKSLMEIHTGETKLKNVSGYLFYILGDMDSTLVGYMGDENVLMLPREFVVDDSIRMLAPIMVTAEDFEETFIIPILEKFEALLEETCRDALPDTNFSFFDNANYIPYEYGCMNTSTAKGVRDYISDMQKEYRSVYKLSSDEYKEFSYLLQDIETLIASYSLKNPEEYIQTDNLVVLELVHKNYPITRDGTAIYVCANNDTLLTRKTVSNIIKKHFLDYDHRVLYEQESACGYVHNTYTVSDMALSGRGDLIGIIVSGGVSSIADAAFYGCENLERITVSDTNTKYSSLDGNLYSADGKTLIRYAPGKQEESFVIPQGVQAVQKYAFKDHNLKSIIIPEGVTEIGAKAFSELYSQEDDEIEIILPKTLKKICEYAFHNTRLREISLPDGIVDIGSYAFENTGLEKIYIPESVESIGVGAFLGNELASVTVDENNNTYQVKDNCLIHTAKKILVFAIIDFEIPDDGSVEIIGNKAFSGLSFSEPIYIPSSVLYIMNGAFSALDEFSGITYAGDPFFFVDINYYMDENGVPSEEYLRAEDYDGENEEHDRALVYGFARNDLYRNEEKIEYYVGIYKDYIKQ